ncbi:hypothetical protein [Puerhibacterium puerhi]|uniref:hypothetical protein n=1 Tax=Puerhibacterium puerhi TaxID=2692623 RepID=UPI00135B3107|nr:hypothetical protein [Puerhibacterium puerhi]
MSDDNSAPTQSPINAWWWVSAGFIVLVVIAIVVAIAARSGSADDDAEPSVATTSQPPVSSSVEPSSSSSARGGACGLPAGSQDIPVTGPDAQWQPSGGYFMVPTSPEAGPIAGEDPAWPCFAHSATGALFAAPHAFAGLAGPEYETFAAAAALPGQARESWIASQDPAAHQGQTAGRVAQIAGFQFQKVEPDAVVVDLGFRQDEVEGSMRVSLVWDDETDNWLIDLATSRFDWVASDLSAFTAWSASDG